MLQLFVYSCAIMEALKMESPMTEWNDDRLDDLNGRVNEGFAKVDERFIRLEGEMKEGFAKVDQRFDKVDQRFDKVDGRFAEMNERFASREEMVDVRTELRHLNERFDRLYYTILVTIIGLVGSLFATNAWG